MPPITNYLSIDVEDYYQVSAFEDVASPANWEAFSSRVERNTTIILEILAAHNIKATFFVVGWIAERHPALVKEIRRQGHEIGCHSYLHRKVYDFTPQQFRDDTQRAKTIIEGILDEPCLGYRAPSYSITQKSLWALDILENLGFQYDSSIFPVYHDLYGIPDAPRFRYQHQNSKLIEFPISTAKVWGKNIPVAGGGYFRLFPYWLTKRLLMTINRNEQQPFMFYLHPWEIDPGQPRFAKARLLSKFRHYNNLDKTAARFTRLLQDFRFGPIS